MTAQTILSARAEQAEQAAMERGKAAAAWAKQHAPGLAEFIKPFGVRWRDVQIDPAKIRRGVVAIPSMEWGRKK